jgi:dihydrofolate reductase
MRKLKIMEHMSLDGVIEVGSEFVYGDWTAPYRTPEGFQQVLKMYGERFDLLLGRKTYDQWSGFWATGKSEAAGNEMGKRMNVATKYVVTHRPESLQWGPVEAVGSEIGCPTQAPLGWVGSPNLSDAVRAIKAQDGQDLVLAGSISLTSALLEHGLVDELVLMVDPVLLGAGKRLFAEGAPPRAFTLEGTRTTPTGIVVQSYKPAGGLRNLG